ncbi:MAG: hypothetical protein ACM3YE_07645, partial [Bacteroidota bacterium]
MAPRKLNRFLAVFYKLQPTPIFKSLARILFMYNLVHLIVATILFYLIPYILNYPPGMIEGGFETKWFGISYLSQFIITMSLVLITGNTFLILLIKNFNTFSTTDRQPIDLNSSKLL